MTYQSAPVSAELSPIEQARINLQMQGWMRFLPARNLGLLVVEYPYADPATLSAIYDLVRPVLSKAAPDVGLVITSSKLNWQALSDHHLAALNLQRIPAKDVTNK